MLQTILQQRLSAPSTEVGAWEKTLRHRRPPQETSPTAFTTKRVSPSYSFVGFASSTEVECSETQLLHRLWRPSRYRDGHSSSLGIARFFLGHYRIQGTATQTPSSFLTTNRQTLQERLSAGQRARRHRPRLQFHGQSSGDSSSSSRSWSISAALSGLQKKIERCHRRGCLNQLLTVGEEASFPGERNRRCFLSSTPSISYSASHRSPLLFQSAILGARPPGQCGICSVLSAKVAFHSSSEISRRHSRPSPCDEHLRSFSTSTRVIHVDLETRRGAEATRRFLLENLQYQGRAQTSKGRRRRRVEEKEAAETVEFPHLPERRAIRGEERGDRSSPGIGAKAGGRPDAVKHDGRGEERIQKQHEISEPANSAFNPSHPTRLSGEHKTSPRRHSAKTSMGHAQEDSPANMARSSVTSDRLNLFSDKEACVPDETQVLAPCTESPSKKGDESTRSMTDSYTRRNRGKRLLEDTSQERGLLDSDCDIKEDREKAKPGTEIGREDHSHGACSISTTCQQHQPKLGERTGEPTAAAGGEKQCIHLTKSFSRGETRHRSSVGGSHRHHLCERRKKEVKKKIQEEMKEEEDVVVREVARIFKRSLRQLLIPLHETGKLSSSLDSSFLHSNSNRTRSLSSFSSTISSNNDSTSSPCLPLPLSATGDDIIENPDDIEEPSFSSERAPHKGKLRQSLLERSSFPLLFAFICKSQQLHAEGLLQLLRLSHKRRLRSIAAVRPPIRPHALRPGERRLLRLKRELEEQKMKLRSRRGRSDQVPLDCQGLSKSFLSHRVPPLFAKQLEEVLLEAAKKFTLVDIQLFLAACCTQARLRTVRRRLFTLGVCTPTSHSSRDMAYPNLPMPDVSSPDKISCSRRNTALSSQQVVHNQDVVLLPSLLKQSSSSSSFCGGEMNSSFSSSLFSALPPCRLPSSLGSNSLGLSSHVPSHVWLLDTLLSSAVLTAVFTITRRRLYELNRERSRHQTHLTSTLQEVLRVSGGWINACRVSIDNIPDKGRGVAEGRDVERVSETLSSEGKLRSILSFSTHEKDSDVVRGAGTDYCTDSNGEDKLIQTQQTCVNSLSFSASSSSTSIPLSFRDGHHIDPVSLSPSSRQSSCFSHSPLESSSEYLFHQQELRVNQQWRQEWRRDMKTVERLFVHFSSLSALLCWRSSSSAPSVPSSLAPIGEVEHIPAGSKQSGTPPLGAEAIAPSSLSSMQHSVSASTRDEVSDPVSSPSDSFVKLSITFLRVLLRLLQTPISVMGHRETGNACFSSYLLSHPASRLNSSRLFDNPLGSSSSEASTGGILACQVNSDELGDSPSPHSRPAFLPLCLVHPSSLARMILVCSSPLVLSSISLDSLATVSREDVKERKSLDTLLSSVYRALHVQLAQQPDKLRTEDLVDLLERLGERLLHTPQTPPFPAVVCSESEPHDISLEAGTTTSSSSSSSSLACPKSSSFSPSSRLPSDTKGNSENSSLLSNRLVSPQSRLLSPVKGTTNSCCFRDEEAVGDRSLEDKTSRREKHGSVMTTRGSSTEDILRAMLEFLLFKVLPSRVDTLSVHLNQRCIRIVKKLQAKFSHQQIASVSTNGANEETTPTLENLERVLSELLNSAHHASANPGHMTGSFHQSLISTDRRSFLSELDVARDLEQSGSHRDREEKERSCKELPVEIQDTRRNTTLLPESEEQQGVNGQLRSVLMEQREKIVGGLESETAVVPTTILGEDKEGERNDENLLPISHRVGRKRRSFLSKMKKNSREEEEMSRCFEGKRPEKIGVNMASLPHTRDWLSSNLSPSSNPILPSPATSHHPSSCLLNLQAPTNMEDHLHTYTCSPLSSPSIRCLLSLFVFGSDMTKQTIERDQARSTMRATAFLYVRCRRYKKRLQAPLELLSGLSKLLMKRYEHERQERYGMNRLIYREVETKGGREEALLAGSPSQEAQDMKDMAPLAAQQVTSSLRNSFGLLKDEAVKEEIQRKNALRSSSHREKDKREEGVHVFSHLLLLQSEEDRLFPGFERVSLSSLSPVPLCDLFLHLQEREINNKRIRSPLVRGRLVRDEIARDEKQGKPTSSFVDDMDEQRTSFSFSSSSQKDYGAAFRRKPSEEEEEEVQQKVEDRKRRGKSFSQRMTEEREKRLDVLNQSMGDRETRHRDEGERQSSMCDIPEKTCVRSAAAEVEMKVGEMTKEKSASYVGSVNAVQELQRLLCLPPERWKSHMASLPTLKLLQALKVCAYQYEGVFSFLEKHQDQLILPPTSLAQAKKEKDRKHAIASPKRRRLDSTTVDIASSEKDKERFSSSSSLVQVSLIPNVETSSEMPRTGSLSGINEGGGGIYRAVLAQAASPWGRLDAFLMCLLDVLTSQLQRKYNKSGEEGGVFHRVAVSLIEDYRRNRERATAVMRGSSVEGDPEGSEEIEGVEELRRLQSTRDQRQLRSTLRLVTPRDVSLGASILRALAVLQQNHEKFCRRYMERRDFARSSENDGRIAQEDRDGKNREVAGGMMEEIVFRNEENRGEEREGMMIRGMDDDRRTTRIDERGGTKKESEGRRKRLVEMKKRYQIRRREQEEEMPRGRSRDEGGMVMLKSVIHPCAEEVLELLLPSHRLWKLSLLQFVQVVYATEVLFLLSPPSAVERSFTSLSHSSFLSTQMNSPSLTGISPASSLCRTSMLSSSITRDDQEKKPNGGSDSEGDTLTETYSTQQASVSPASSTLGWEEVHMVSSDSFLSPNRRQEQEEQLKPLIYGKKHSRLLSDLSPSVKRHLFALLAVTESLLQPLPGVKRVNDRSSDRREHGARNFQVSKEQQEGMLSDGSYKRERELAGENHIQPSIMTTDERRGAANVSTTVGTSSKEQERSSGTEGGAETKREMTKEKETSRRIDGLASFSSLHHSRRTPLPFTAIAPLTRSFTAMYRRVYLSVEQLRVERRDREKRMAEEKTLGACEQHQQEEGREAEDVNADEAAISQRAQDSILPKKTVAATKPLSDEPYFSRRLSSDDSREEEELKKSLRDGEALLEEYEKVLLRLAAEAVCVSHRLSEKHWRTIGMQGRVY